MKLFLSLQQLMDQETLVCKMDKLPVINKSTIYIGREKREIKNMKK